MDRETMDSLLEMHLHGELPPELRRRAEALLATPEGRKRWEELRESDRRILEELPPEKVADAVRLKLAQVPQAPARASASRSPAWWVAGTALAALGVVAFTMSSRTPRTPSPGPVATTTPNSAGADRRDSAAAPSKVDLAIDGLLGGRKVPVAKPESVVQVARVEPHDDGIRTKGGEFRRLRIHRREAGAGAVESVRDGDTAAAGAVLQVSVAKGAAMWGVVVSVDAAGQATLHLPESGDSAIRMEADVAAPHSFQLDDSRGFERFYLIGSNARFSLDEALAAVRRAGIRPPAREGWNVESIRVIKP